MSENSENLERGKTQSKTKSKTSKLSCQDYALFLLSLRAQSTATLKEKLQRKAYQAAEISAAIKRLTELSYLNDDQFAQIFFDNLKKYKGFGYFGIKKKLMLKKIGNPVIERLLKSLSLKEETEIAQRQLARQKSKTYEQKARMLQAKGFRPAVIFQVVKVDVE